MVPENVQDKRNKKDFKPPKWLTKKSQFEKKSDRTKEERYNIQNEMKTFQQRMIVLMAVFIVLVSIIVFVGPYINKPMQKSDVSAQQVKETEFKSILTSFISELSTENNKQYALDEHYYNEEDVLTYISIMVEHDSNSVTKEELRKLFWNIFIPVKNNGVVGLVKKDNETLIMECDDKEKMNMLDHAFMGIINNEIIEASKGVYISQNNDKFENIPYGTANVKSSGCGPVSLTMALNYVNGTEIVKLEDVLKWAEDNNMYEENSGTRWSLVRNFPPTVSINSKEMHISNIEQLATTIQEGEVLVTSMQKGQFTDNGHFIVITEIKDGKVSVLDPASICRSLKEWDIETIFEESNKYFWKISK